MGGTSAMKKLLRLKRYVRSGNAVEPVGLRDVGRLGVRSQGTVTASFSKPLVAAFFPFCAFSTNDVR